MDLRSFIHVTRTTVSAIAKDLNVSQPTVTQWKNGIAIPNMKNMERVIIYTKGLVLPNDFFPDLINKFGKAD